MHEIIDSIYEAAAQPSRWPLVLDEIGHLVGAAGGLIVVEGTNGAANFVSESLLPLLNRGREEGHFKSMDRCVPMLEQMLPQFITDTDMRPIEEMKAMPVYRDFLTPEKMDASAGTVFQGSDNDIVVMTIDGFASHEASRAARPQLDLLRPHLGRAVSLSSQARMAREQAIVDSLEMLGSGAAIVRRNGALRAWNAKFEARLGRVADDRPNRLRFSDSGTDARLVAAIADLGSNKGGSSIVLRPSADELPCAMHIIPFRRSAQDIFNSDGALLLLADGNNRRIPNGDLLRLLFDLTPGEARLARTLLQQEDLRLAAVAAGMTYQTARVYLKAIFQKTATNRQSSLIRLLSGYGPPSSTHEAA